MGCSALISFCFVLVASNPLALDAASSLAIFVCSRSVGSPGAPLGCPRLKSCRFCVLSWFGFVELLSLFASGMMRCFAWAWSGCCVDALLMSIMRRAWLSIVGCLSLKWRSCSVASRGSRRRTLRRMWLGVEALRGSLRRMTLGGEALRVLRCPRCLTLVGGVLGFRGPAPDASAAAPDAPVLLTRREVELRGAACFFPLEELSARRVAARPSCSFSLSRTGRGRSRSRSLARTSVAATVAFFVGFDEIELMERFDEIEPMEPGRGGSRSRSVVRTYVAAAVASFSGFDEISVM